MDHMLPVWESLPEENRGGFFIIKGLEGWHRTVLKAKQWKVPSWVVGAERGTEVVGGGPVVGAGYSDITWASGVTKRPLVLMEHGAGQSYEDAWHPGMQPGRGVENKTVLQLLPGEATRGPKNCASKVVGSPRVEHFRNKFPIWRTTGVVAVSFHWDCFAVPESYSAWPYFWSALLPLSRKFEVLGHGHPRILDRLAPLYEKLGIEVVWDFEDVLERAQVLACDNSSALYEFASIGKPVVVLNAPWFRRDVDHGLRFWDQAGIGVNCDFPDQLPTGVEIALEDGDFWADRRYKTLDQVYDLRPGAPARAAAAIMEIVE